MAATEDAPPFIAVAASPVIIGRSGEVTLRLLHPTISRRHATITRRDKGFTLEDHDSRFGTVVNGARVRKVTLRTGDRVQFGSAAVYRVEPEAYISMSRPRASRSQPRTWLSTCRGHSTWAASSMVCCRSTVRRSQLDGFGPRANPSSRTSVSGSGPIPLWASSDPAVRGRARSSIAWPATWFPARAGFSSTGSVTSARNWTPTGRCWDTYRRTMSSSDR